MSELGLRVLAGDVTVESAAKIQRAGGGETSEAHLTLGEKKEGKKTIHQSWKDNEHVLAIWK